MIPIHVSMLPAFAEQFDLTGQVAVVIDVLRASTTIVHALANGAPAVIPCSTVKQAWELANRIPVEERILGGERHCQVIEGFDLDNSPLNYTPHAISGRTLIFTSTNGTYALDLCRSATHIFIGSFVNLSALVKTLQQKQLPVHLVCAGTNRNLTAEDILLAGAVVDQLSSATESKFEIVGVQAQMALDFYRCRNANPATFRKTMFESLGAESLIKLGMQPDIERAMQIDLFQIVPEWDARERKLVSSK